MRYQTALHPDMFNIVKDLKEKVKTFFL